MQFTRLGNTGLAVSRLAFGNMTFGTDPRFPSVAKVDLDTARTMIHGAFDAGVNFFDTANGYSNGEAEKYLGEFLGEKRTEVVIATKCGFRSGKPITQAGLSRRHIFEACESSLKKLKTDWIDLYIVHKVDPYTPIEETLEALNDLVRSERFAILDFPTGRHGKRRWLSHCSAIEAGRNSRADKCTIHFWRVTWSTSSFRFSAQRELA